MVLYGGSLMQEIMTLTNSLVRIYDERGKVVGAGARIDENIIVTCMHVVQYAVNKSEPKERYSIDLDFPFVDPSRKIKAKIINLGEHDKGTNISASNDVAILRLLDAPPAMAESLRFITSNELWGHAFRAFGFPKGYDQGIWVSGEIKAPQSDGWLQIDSSENNTYWIEPGFSGTPIWDEKAQAAVGIAVATDSKQGIKAAYVIPSTILQQFWPALKTKQPVDLIPRYETSVRDPFHSNSSLYPKFLVEQLKIGNVVPFIGSELSSLSGVPTWEKIIRHVLQSTGQKQDEYLMSDQTRLSQIIQDNHLSIKQTLIQFLSRPWRPNDLHEALLSFNFDTIVTTNYDSLIEKSLEYYEWPVNRIWKQDQLFQYNEKDAIQILKPNGSIEDTSDLVLNKQDFDTFKRNNTFFFQLLRTVFLTKTVLFIGVTLDDPNFQILMDELMPLNSHSKMHYGIFSHLSPSDKQKMKERSVHLIDLDEGGQQHYKQWFGGLKQQTKLSGNTNKERAVMINSSIENEINLGLTGARIRMRAALGIISNPNELVDNSSIYGTHEQDELEFRMGKLLRNFLDKSPANKYYSIVHVNPEVQLQKGYKKKNLIVRLKAMNNFIQTYPDQIELAHSFIPVALNQVIVGNSVSYTSFKQETKIGYNRFYIATNRWVIQSETINFDEDLESIRLANKETARLLGIDVSKNLWHHEFSEFIIRNAIETLEKSSIVLECDEKGNIIQPVSRSVAHQTGILHKSLHLHLYTKVDGKIKVLVQKRPLSKDLYGGMIDVGVAGHQESSDAKIEMLREVSEELRIWMDQSEIRLAYSFDRENGNDHELIDVYYADASKVIEAISNNFSSEVDSLFWLEINELDKKEDYLVDGFISYAGQKLPITTTLERADFTPGFLDELIILKSKVF